MLTNTLTYLSCWLEDEVVVMNCGDLAENEPEKEEKKFGEDADDKIPGTYSTPPRPRRALCRSARHCDLRTYLVHPEILTPPPEA